MANIAHKTRDENKSAVTAAPTTCSTGQLIRAKDFLTCFRQKPDDLYLMQKFSLSPKQLAKVYQALIEKGLLTEFEYHYLRGIPPLVLEGRNCGPNRGEPTTKNRTCETRGTEPPADKRPKLRNYFQKPVSRIESLPDPRMSGPKSRNKVMERSGKELLHRPDVCPRCCKATDPCSPDTCMSCGVIFSKFRRTAKRQEVSCWQSDFRYR